MHKTMRSLFILFLIVSSIFITGCGSTVPVIKPFKLDIQQGNVVTSKMLLQLRPGMTKSQVRFIMGTPLVVDSFHTNRWDYFYQMRQAGKIIEQRRVILDFENELLARVRGDVVPQGTPGADTGVALANESGAQLKAAPKEGLLENLKFWRSREPEEVKPDPKVQKTLIQPTTETRPKTDVVEPKKEVMPSTESAATITNEPSAITETPTAKPAASEAEPPSMLAVPIQIGPTPAESRLDEPTQNETVKGDSVEEESTISTPTENTPAVIAPVQIEPSPVATPNDSPVTEAVPDSMPEPAQVDQENRFIFRMDKQLDTKNLESKQPPTSENNAKPSVETNKASPEQEPEQEYGYFERLMEKIGF